jgi:hypothetical protein
MTTPYGISCSNGTFTGNVGSAVVGPLTTNNAPNAMSQHNYGVLSGARPTPPQFGCSDTNTLARHQYFRTAESANSLAIQRERTLAKASSNSMFSYSTGVKQQTSGHMNYIAPMDSSSHIDRLKSRAVGKSIQLPNLGPVSTKVFTPSDTRSSLRRARSSGCVAPKKKGAI